MELMELDEFKQKFNLPRINSYLNKMNEEEANKFWQAFWDIRQTFPRLDIYFGDSGKEGYIGIGVKPIGSVRVKDFIFVSMFQNNKDEQGNYVAAIGIQDNFYNKIRNYDNQIEGWIRIKDLSRDQYQEWLNCIKNYTIKSNIDLAGQGLLPTDYITQNISAAQAIEFLKERYPDTYSATTHIAAFRTSSDRQLALDPKTKTTSIFCDAEPPEYLGLHVKTFYDGGKTRNHHLSTHAPKLDKGFEAYLVSINKLNDLERFCEWYELDTNNEFNEDKEMPKKMIVQPLNRILFGAAGTGKTYNTINHALSIIEDKALEDLEQEKREELKIKFDDYKKQGRIQFVTFHQSFSYEDFVEGIRANTVEDKEGQKNIEYPVVSGVFKELCEKATGESQQAESIDEIVERFLDEITETPLELYTQQNKKFKVSSLGSGLTLQCQPLASETNATYYANIGKIKDLLSGKEIDNAYNRSYIKAVAEYLKPKVKPVKKNKPNEKYVLIIDEINRGNISRIFGELITLIEDSKRQGAEEELSVTLPYSKKEFTVPKNLYIIGTMNSSDRSLTGLDIALRRRFTFIEMPPHPELLKEVIVEGLNIGDLLSIINERIEVLLDRDHCIGHANFMSLKNNSSIENLAQIFQQKIIPQLQEYFFDDWSKINLVLFNNGMLTPKDSTKMMKLFPKGFEEETGSLDYKKLWKINVTAFNDIKSYQAILGNIQE